MDNPLLTERRSVLDISAIHGMSDYERMQATARMEQAMMLGDFALRVADRARARLQQPSCCSRAHDTEAGVTAARRAPSRRRGHSSALRSPSELQSSVRSGRIPAWGGRGVGLAEIVQVDPIGHGHPRGIAATIVTSSVIEPIFIGCWSPGGRPRRTTPAAAR
jgi:hypothetical protein